MAAATEAVQGAAGKPIVSVDVMSDGLAQVTLNDVSETLNTITPRLATELLAALARVEEDSRIRGALVVSGKKESFVVGANIDMLKEVKFAQDAERMAREFAQGLAKIQRGKKPVVAVVHGAALGGGFELALACHAIVASDDRKTVLGLPEVQLGLIPAANGMQRIAERAGLQVALDLALTGKSTRAAKAKKLGLLDEVCPSSVLYAAAAKVARDLEGKLPRRPPRRRMTPATFALEKNPLGRALLFKKARDEARKKTHGHYPATERIIGVLERFASKGFDAGAELEAKSFGELVVSETAHRLIEIFFATNALKKDTGVDDATVQARPVERVALLGGGLMGGGIAYVTIGAGIPVRMKEKDDPGVARGLKYVRSLLDERLAKRQISALERDQTFALLTAATDFTGLKHADVVIEAVFEDLELKRSVLREVEAHAGEGAIFASNTSSIPITKIAEGAKRPENVVGMHYFSPVHKMPLLEIIRTDKTAPDVVGAAVALGKKQGKTCIVVKDGAGFYTSRILAPYMNEAAYMLAEGVPVDVIDEALVDWGWPVGPMQLLDEVGIDVAAHVGEIMWAAFGDRLTPPPVMARLFAEGRKGRKNERGLYRYGKGAVKAGKRQVDATVYETLGVQPRAKPPREEIQMRCSLQLVNEALLCLGDGILRNPRDGDVGAIFGLGFPPFRGGPFRYVDAIGAAEVLRRVQGYHDRFGKRWVPAPLLVQIAKKGGRVYAE